MQLDDVVDATHTDEERFQEARHRTVRWLDRCIVAHKNTEKQNLFPIVQGSINLNFPTFVSTEKQDQRNL